MPESMFLTLIKYWCNGLDESFDVLAHPWKPEELHYRRMLCTIFGQSWKLKKSFSWIINFANLPTTHKETRGMLIEATRYFWCHNATKRDMTPAWPRGTVEYMEELFNELLSHARTDEKTVQAFRLMNEIGDLHVPKKLLPERVGMEKNVLFQRLSRLERRLRSPENARRLTAFAFQDRSPSIGQIIHDWKEKKKQQAWDAAGEGVPYDIGTRSVEELELSIRTYNVLRNANIQTVGDLLKKTEAEILRLRNSGRKSLIEIREVLTSIDPKLKIGMLAPKPTEFE
jgi:hypothetical protein